MSTTVQESTPDVLNLQKLDPEGMSRLMEMDFSGGSCLTNSCNSKPVEAE
jgi:hypothetical protein